MNWILLLLGCDEDASSAFTALESNETTQALEAAWTPDEVVEQMDALMAYGIPNPYPIRDIYLALYEEGGTSSCPGTNYNFDGSEADNAGCRTDDGYFYAGLGEVRTEEGRFDLHCDCRIVTPDGRMIQGAGNLNIIEENSHTILDIRGSFLEIKSEYAGSWLEELPSISLSIVSGSGETIVNGGYTINNLSIYMENFMFASCGARDGIIYFRDPSGGWWSWTAQTSCTEGLLAFQGKEYGVYTWDSSQFDTQVQIIMEAE